MRRRYIVYARQDDGSSYETKTFHANTVMGVARHVTELHRAGLEILRWEVITYDEPTAQERQSLAALLAIVNVPVPRR